MMKFDVQKMKEDLLRAQQVGGRDSEGKQRARTAAEETLEARVNDRLDLQSRLLRAAVSRTQSLEETVVHLDANVKELREVVQMMNTHLIATATLIENLQKRTT